MVDSAPPSTDRDPFAPVQASPRFATPLALLALVCAVLSVVSYAEVFLGPLGMALGLIAHVKGSRLGMPAAVVAALAMVVGMSVTWLLR
ncbi:hypothetical protein [Egicoccus halophilus]|uniref:Uncharacterized protein n=1 Tax=Egicoccus halophilus TaxID=1670830 RepID=A0A8J3ESH8_9ACTN|nr:hypothetical protein [Egicoccus halophilus]GGI03357.1 hypothetical protein GCM10011354_03630 [Egicoccus halophilus]